MHCAYEQVSLRLESLDRHVAGLSAKIDALGQRLDTKIDAFAGTVDAKFGILGAKIDKRFLWTVGIIFGSWLTTMLGVVGLFLKR
jgi:hypothetical protein